MRHWPICTSSPHPHPNTLAPLSVFSWYSFLVEWPQTQAVYLLQLMEFGLADENNLSQEAVQKHEALLRPPAQRKLKGKVKCAGAPRSTRGVNKTDFHFYRHFLPREARLAVDFCLRFRMKTKQLSYFSPQPTACNEQ